MSFFNALSPLFLRAPASSCTSSTPVFVAPPLAMPGARLDWHAVTASRGPSCVLLSLSCALLGSSVLPT